MKKIHDRLESIPILRRLSGMSDSKCQKLTDRQLEQYRRFLLYYLNIRLLQDYLLQGDAIGARMLWLYDLELIME